VRTPVRLRRSQTESHAITSLCDVESMLVAQPGARSGAEVARVVRVIGDAIDWYHEIDTTVCTLNASWRSRKLVIDRSRAHCERRKLSVHRCAIRATALGRPSRSTSSKSSA
jgi:hypothetical protein